MREDPTSEILIGPEPTHISGRANLVLGAYLIALNIICLALIFALWPGIKEMFPNIPINPPDEIRLLLISTVAGALGSTVLLLLSFVFYAGHRSFPRSSVWLYVARPLAGMSTGLFVYIAIRGGILKTGNQVGVDVLNPYTVATIAVLAGAFSHEILLKLKGFADSQLSETNNNKKTNQHKNR